MSPLVVDTSAVVALLEGEFGHREIAGMLEGASHRMMAAPTLVELGMVMEAKKGPAASAVVDRFVRDGELEIVPFDHDLSLRALEGWRRFGKGRHAAGLNLGDCFAYALAVREGAAVLCVGADLAATDLEVVGPGAGTGG